MLARSESASPATVQRTGTALRSLLRFFHLRGVIGASLVGAVPTAANWRLAGLPKYLTAEQTGMLLASCDLATAVGRRDLAIMTLLARLGLRASEVAVLRLEDIDWRRGEITVRGKGDRHERLPGSAHNCDRCPDRLASHPCRAVAHTRSSLPAERAGVSWSESAPGCLMSPHARSRALSSKGSATVNRPLLEATRSGVGVAP